MNISKYVWYEGRMACCIANIKWRECSFENGKAPVESGKAVVENGEFALLDSIRAS